MKIIETKISGVRIIQSDSSKDERGSFSRWFCMQELSDVLGDKTIVQINHSLSADAGTVRGLHFQKPPHAEIKLVRCMKGRIWDVALDLRAGSPTFLKYHAQELSAENNLMMLIPEGCAHGFQVIEPDSELLYLHTEFYMQGAEGGIQYDDPRLSISWPMQAVNVSKRDREHPLLTPDYKGIVL